MLNIQDIDTGGRGSVKPPQVGKPLWLEFAVKTDDQVMSCMALRSGIGCETTSVQHDITLYEEACLRGIISSQVSLIL